MNKAEQLLKKQNAEAVARARQNANAEKAALDEIERQEKQAVRDAQAAQDVAGQWSEAAAEARRRYGAALSASQAWGATEQASAA